MLKKISILFLFCLALCACSSSEDNLNTTTDTFDRGALLTHIADNIIIPSYQDFKSKMDALKASGTSFTTTPNQTTLQTLRADWLAAYKEWQHVEMFNIGKAEDLQYHFYMNVFPLTVADVEANISSGSYDLNSVNNQDAQGFPALDYLLYGIASNDTDILDKYTTDANATSYKNYVTDVLTQMSSLTDQVLTDWTNSYRNIFINNSGNTATSALNKLVNDFIFYYEKGLRANKFGIPAGVFSSNPLPEKVEAFYNQNISKELALEALIAVQDVFVGEFKGNSFANSSSFKDYLNNLDRTDLANSITTQLNVAKTQINSLNTNFYSQVNTDNSKMLKSYDELQKVVVLLKVDMLQAFNINVDYVDADGD